MYKPKNTSGTTNRLRLDIEPKIPSIYRIEEQFQEAKGRRGCLIELPWKTDKAAQMFILGVQWDTNSDLPIWTLYEQNNMESKMHWSEQYPPNDLQIMFDVVVMSVSSSEQQAKIPDSLRPPEQSGASAQPALGTNVPPPPAPSPPPGLAGPGLAPPPQQMQYPPPGYGMPQMPYPMDPNMQPPPGYPPYPYYGAPGGYPGAPPGWPYAPPPMPQVPPQAPAGQPAPAPEAPPSQSQSQAPVDYTLISKRAKVQLGKLLVESKIISQSTLDAALKLQELVEDEQLTLEAAPNALMRYHTKGAAIGEYINMPEPEVEQPEEKKRTKIGEVPETAKLPITPPKSAAEAKAAFDLLQKAGIVTELDIRNASDVRKKHGGDIITILQSAGKIDKFTFESSVVCLPLIELGLMKLEQAVIALQYCNRMRVDFDTALEELGWQNPRKMRKDLQL
ncbi:MAG TPA: hypothetical protein V6C81_18830 [Planktothrix sp.]|jgi:hypothetical protein